MLNKITVYLSQVNKHKWLLIISGLILLAILLIGGIYLSRPQELPYHPKLVNQELATIHIKDSPNQASYWSEEAVEPGDTLSEVLTRIGIPSHSIHMILNQSPLDNSTQLLRSGQIVSVHIDATGDADNIQFFNDPDNGERDLIAIEKIDGKWQTAKESITMQTIPSLRKVVVHTSARGAMARAGIPVEIRESLNQIMSSQFNLNDLTDGDTITLLYDIMYFHGQEMATGDILAAEVTTAHKTYYAYYFAHKDNQGGSYYDQNGMPLIQSGFNIAPVAFTRISSPYGMRIHPIFHTVRMHTGIDYAAPTGTPIKAPADGKVIFQGWKGGYGNAVMLLHNNGIETLYGHLSAFAPIKGDVRAGDVIGYVGSTGQATGPHLHYEARINGRPVNPSSIALPTPKLSPADKIVFIKQQKEINPILATVQNLTVPVTPLD